MENQDLIARYINNILEEKEILIYNANSNLALDVDHKALKAWHPNFN